MKSRAALALFSLLSLRCASTPGLSPSTDGAYHGQFQITPAADSDRMAAGADRSSSASTDIIVPGSYLSSLRRDTFQLAAAPLSWDRQTWLKAGAGLALVGAALLADGEVREGVDAQITDEPSELARAIAPLGANYSFALLGGFWVAGRYGDHPRAASVARDGLTASLLAGGVITPLLKVAVQRERPWATDKTLSFGSGGASFPSGHTTQAFAVASVIAAHYDSRWVKFTAYGLASLVGASRIESGAHFTSDVVAGALIGTVVGRSVVRMHREEAVEIGAAAPLDPGSGGMAVGVHLDGSRLLNAVRRR